MQAILWCNGELPSEEITDNLDPELPIFGIDGGADKATRCGFHVHEALGDFDSIDLAEWSGRRTKLDDASSSDLSKSLNELAHRGYDSIDVVGIDGGCPDHILGIWASLAEAPGNLCIRLLHEEGVSVRIHPDEGKTDFEIEVGQEFSVFALTSCQNVTITGAKWNLENESLSFSTRGLHNIAIENVVSIFGDGILVVIIH